MDPKAKVGDLLELQGAKAQARQSGLAMRKILSFFRALVMVLS